MKRSEFNSHRQYFQQKYSLAFRYNVTMALFLAPIFLSRRRKLKKMLFLGSLSTWYCCPEIARGISRGFDDEDSR